MTPTALVKQCTLHQLGILFSKPSSFGTWHHGRDQSSSFSLAEAQCCIRYSLIRQPILSPAQQAASHFLLFDRRSSEDVFSFRIKMAVGEIHTYEEHHEIQLQHVREIGRYIKQKHGGVCAK